MGVLLDTSVPIKATRIGLSETALMQQIYSIVGLAELGTSAVAMTELLHGIYRAKSPEVRRRREEFAADFVRDIPVHPFQLTTAHLAGRIGGEQAALGRTIPPIDLMIGATALSLNFSILTTNVRHFRMIPGLDVIAF